MITPITDNYMLEAIPAFAMLFLGVCIMFALGLVMGVCDG